jgi:hypothetical protein
MRVRLGPWLASTSARALAFAVAVVGSMALPAAASAFDPPQLYIARAATFSDRGSNPWMPLNGAHIITGGTYRLGVAVQATGSSTDTRQYVLMQAISVPGGKLPAGTTGPGSCSEVRGNLGDIADFGAVVFAGEGTYSLQVALTAFVQGPCPTSGAVTQAAFTVDARPSIQIVGVPRANDSRPDGPFRGVTETLAGDTLPLQFECARNPRVLPDGSLAGTQVTRQDSVTSQFAEGDAFPGSGHWACVARGQGDLSEVPTAWSAPAFVTVPGDFQIQQFDRIDETPPRVVIRLETGDPGTAGGTITIPLVSCRRYTAGHRRRKGPTLRTRVDSNGNATFRFKLRRFPLPVYYMGRPRFSGSPFVPAVTAPAMRVDDYNDLEFGHIISIGPASPCR